jgi:ATP-dependent RNA helicase HelY
MGQAWADVRAIEDARGVPASRELQAGFAWSTHRWASGSSLRAILQESDLTAGDFVRWTRQVIDLLGQIAQAAGTDDRVAGLATEAIDRLSRGVVAQSSEL